MDTLCVLLASVMVVSRFWDTCHSCWREEREFWTGRGRIMAVMHRTSIAWRGKHLGLHKTTRNQPCQDGIFLSRL